MAELGYSVEWQVLDSQHFGVPQHRERVFIIGRLGRGSGRKIFPFRENSAAPVELRGHITAGTLTTRTGEANSVGTYIADRQTDRQTDDDIKSQWIPQAVMDCRYQGNPKFYKKTIGTICARDYKGGLYVIEK